MTQPLLYDRERSALRDLARLTAERAEREAYLEATLHAAQSAAERDLTAARAALAAAREREARALDEEWQKAQADVTARAAAHSEALAHTRDENRMRVTD